MTLGNMYPYGYGRCQLLHCPCGVVILGLYFILLLVLHSRSVVSSTKQYLSLLTSTHPRAPWLSSSGSGLSLLSAGCHTK